jgi:hypothetical protein
MKTSLAIATPTSAVKSAEARVSAYDWKNLSDELSGFGCTVIRQLLSPDECRQISALYPEEGQFRSHIHMARHGFGKGEYKYFKYPLPDILGGLRTALYPRLAGIANEWNGRMGIEVQYPEASDISSPPCLLRLLPAGAGAGWDLHPLESAALHGARDTQPPIPTLADGGHLRHNGRGPLRPFRRLHSHDGERMRRFTVARSADGAEPNLLR